MDQDGEILRAHGFGLIRVVKAEDSDGPGYVYHVFGPDKLTGVPRCYTFGTRDHAMIWYNHLVCYFHLSQWMEMEKQSYS